MCEFELLCARVCVRVRIFSLSMTLTHYNSVKGYTLQVCFLNGVLCCVMNQNLQTLMDFNKTSKNHFSNKLRHEQLFRNTKISASTPSLSQLEFDALQQQIASPTPKKPSMYPLSTLTQYADNKTQRLCVALKVRIQRSIMILSIGCFTHNNNLMLGDHK